MRYYALIRQEKLMIVYAAFYAIMIQLIIEAPLETINKQYIITQSYE